jgi:hypothetical protein
METSPITLRVLPARQRRDRNVFLVFTILIWVAVLSGFGTDVFEHHLIGH